MTTAKWYESTVGSEADPHWFEPYFRSHRLQAVVVYYPVRMARQRHV